MSVYKVIELIGTSDKSWEDAAVGAVTLARQSLRELRVAEVIEQDLDLGDGNAVTYRTKLPRLVQVRGWPVAPNEATGTLSGRRSWLGRAVRSGVR